MISSCCVILDSLISPCCVILDIVLSPCCTILRWKDGWTVGQTDRGGGYYENVHHKGVTLVMDKYYKHVHHKGVTLVMDKYYEKVHHNMLELWWTFTLNCPSHHVGHFPWESPSHFFRVDFRDPPDPKSLCFKGDKTLRFMMQ